MRTVSQLTHVGTKDGNRLYRYQHLFIEHVGDVESPDRYRVLKTDRQTEMHRSTLKGCKRYCTNRKKDLDAISEENGIGGSEIASALA
jgi:hypothetical protein